MIDWSIPSGDGTGRILGTSHLPSGEPTGRVLLGHGFKGYKDYGFLPWLSRRLCEAGHVVHRFNFGGSGMDHGHGPFDPAAFQADTWNRQVEDAVELLRAVGADELPGGPGPVLLVGHSRGGVTSLLAAGRHAGTDALASLRGVATLASPSGCLGLEASDRARLLTEGSLESPSSRTGQMLRIGRAFLQEQLDDPEGHDPLRQAGRVRVPVLVVHGMADDAVPVESAHQLVGALGDLATLRIIEGGNHVFNVPNPFPMEHGEPSPQLDEVARSLVQFAQSVFTR